MKSFSLPEDMLLGVATASLQIEGGDTNNSWYRFCNTGKIKDNTNCYIACDHYNRGAEDTALMKDIGIKIYRMSIEWSRIEPKKGEFNNEAINHYRKEIEELIANGIKPFITLHHFSNPLWFEDQGGWCSSEAPDYFDRYTELLVRSFGDIVSDWITINEPNIYLVMGYIAGYWPPEKINNFKLFKKGALSMIKAHIRSYMTIHRERSNMGYEDSKVGAAFHIRDIESASDKYFDKKAAEKYDDFFNNSFVEGFVNGRIISPLGNGYPFGKGIYSDFIGINYYSRDIIGFSFNPLRKFIRIETQKNSEYNDLGWEIYPNGMYNVIMKYHNKYNLPIHITENGICDKDDKKRSHFIYSHLDALTKSVADGAKVNSYCHWTFMDNFEWREGLSARFGLIEVDFNTQQRRIRKSGEFYKEIISNCGVTEELINKYLSS